MLLTVDAYACLQMLVFALFHLPAAAAAAGSCVQKLQQLASASEEERKRLEAQYKERIAQYDEKLREVGRSVEIRSCGVLATRGEDKQAAAGHM